MLVGRVHMQKTQVDHIVDYAKSWLGTPYVWGGEGFEGFDCSGLLQEILRGVGLDPKGDQTANGLYRFFEENYAKSFSEPVAGNPVFYGTADQVTHCGFGIGQGLIIEAAGGGRNTTTPSTKAFVRMRPYDYRNDYLCQFDLIF